MSEESPKSPRTTQIAMLTAVAATVVLSMPTTASALLKAAGDALEQWPTSGERFRAACVDAFVDVPSRMTVRWLDEHRQDNHVFARCYYLDKTCSALRMLDLLYTDKPCSSDDAANGSQDNWKLNGLVEVASSDGDFERLARARSSYCQLERDGKALEDAATAARDKLDTRLREFGAPGAADAKRSWNDAGSRWTQRQNEVVNSKRSIDQLKEELKRSSDALAGQAYQGGTSRVLLQHTPDPGDAARLRVVTRLEFKAPGECKQQPCSSLLPASDLARCVHLIDTEIVPDAPGHGGAPGSNADPWGFETLTKAAIWTDIHDQDVFSAHSILRDKQGKAELEGEVFGIKLEAADAVRWSWLPITSLELYALALAWQRRRTRDAPNDWWEGFPWQLAMIGCAELGVLTSFSEGFRRCLSSVLVDWRCLASSASILVLYAAWVALVVRARRPATPPFVC